MESGDERFCSNCKRYVSSANFSIHSAFCERNIFVCKICEEPVSISEKDEHLEEYHSISPCNLCEAPLEKWLLPKHMEICPKRLLECKYCGASFPLDEFTEHVEFCGSRTEKCLLCQKYIMNKDKSKHDEIHLLEKQYRAKSIEDEIKQNKVNEVISKKSTPEKIYEKGTSADQDNRLSDKQKKPLKQLKFNEILNRKVDMNKINLDDVKPWIAQRIADMLGGIETDVVIEFVFNQLEAEQYPDARKMQINLTGFLNKKNAREFMTELWALLISAEDIVDGIPAAILEQKKDEIKKRMTRETNPSMPSRISEGKDACFLDKVKSKTSREDCNFEIPVHSRGASSLTGREISKHYTECHICKQTIPWIDYNTHVPACASSAGKCAVCAEFVPSSDFIDHMKSHFQGRMNNALKVSENYKSSNETTYRSIQSNSAKSKTHSSVMKCPYCSELCSEDQVLEHTRSCTKNSYECPLCCETIPEKNKKRHEESECRMVQDNVESSNTDFSRCSQNYIECPLCLKQIPEESYDSHLSLLCEKLFHVGDTQELYAAGEDLYECVLCLEKMPQKDKKMHQSFSCKVLIENSGININGLDSYADVTKKTDPNSYKNEQSSETCPTCKNSFHKGKISEHRNKCSRLKESCMFCDQLIDVTCRDIHLKYCPGIDKEHKTTVAQDFRLSNYNHKGAIPKNTSIKDMMKPRSAKCTYCQTSYNVDILPNHEKECIHMPVHCEHCDQDILLKDINTHKCKRKKSKGKWQKGSQQVSEEKSDGGIFSRAKRFFMPNDEKEARGRQNFTQPSNYYASDAYVPDSVKTHEKLYFDQADNTLLPCEFCQQEFPASQLVLHETGCQPDLVSYAKADLPENSDSKQGSVQKDSATFKSQNIHSAGGINHPFFAKHDASEHIEHNRKLKIGELPQSYDDKNSYKHLENSKKNENGVEKKSLNFESVWNISTSNFRSDNLKENLDNSYGKTDETNNLNEKQTGKEGLGQQTPEKHSPNDNEIDSLLTFLHDSKSESDEEFHSLPDENGPEEHSEMKINISMNPQKIIQEKPRESALLKKITNEEKIKEIVQETLKSDDKAERKTEEYLKQLSADFRFGALKTTLPFETNMHCDIQSDKKYEDLEEPSRFSERSKNQKEYGRYFEDLSDLKLGRYQSVAFSGGANVNEMIDKEPDKYVVKKATTFSGSCNDQKNHANSSKLLANFNLGSDSLSFAEIANFPVQTVNNDEPKKLHEQQNSRSTYCTNDVKENFNYFKNGADISTVLSNKLEQHEVLPKEHNKEPEELYNQNNSRLFGTIGEDSEYIRNYRQYLPGFKLNLETIRKYSEDNVTNVTLPESRNVHNVNRAFTLEPAGSLTESKLPRQTVLKTGVKELGLEERIAAFHRNKKTLSSAANNNTGDFAKWGKWRKKKESYNASGSDSED